jgi:hypothetical protein
LLESVWEALQNPALLFEKKHLHLFEKLNLGKRIFAGLKAQLKAKGGFVQSRHGEVVWLFWTASIVDI